MHADSMLTIMRAQRASLSLHSGLRICLLSHHTPITLVGGILDVHGFVIIGKSIIQQYDDHNIKVLLSILLLHSNISLTKPRCART